MFIKTKDYELSNIMTKGPYIPKTTIDGKSVMQIKD